MAGGTLHRRGASGWNPSADATNAPAGTLLRADNLQLDESNTLVLRKGSSKINGTPYADLDVHSLASFDISGSKLRIAGAGANLYVNGVSQALTLAGSGDVAFGAHLGQVFAARSTSKYKHDGTTLRTWGLPTPTLAPTVAAVDLASKYLATCNSTESPAFSADEGTITSTYPTGEDGTANGAIEVTPSPSTGRASIKRILTSSTDYLKFGSARGGSHDSFQMSVYLGTPESVEFVEILISCVGAASVTDYFKTDYYRFRWIPNETTAVALTSKQIIANMTDEAIHAAKLDLSYTPGTSSADAASSVANGTPQAAVRTDNEDLMGVSMLKSTKNTWQTLVIPRGSFERVGNTSGMDWSTIKGVTLVYKATAGSTGVCRFDSIKFISADESKLLTGRYRFRYRFVRQFAGYKAYGPISPESSEILLQAQAVRLTIPGSCTTGLDTQVDTIESFVTGGLLDQWYKCGSAYLGARESGLAKNRMRIDEFDSIPDGGVSDNDRWAGPSFCIYPGFAKTPRFVAGSDFLINCYASETSLLLAYEPLGAGDTTPPDDIIDIEGPYFDRLLCLTSKYLYISRRRCPEVFCKAHVIAATSGLDEEAFWVKKTLGGLYVGTSRDIYRIEGSFEDQPDGTLSCKKTPLNCGFPPVSTAVTQEANGIIYEAADGPRSFNGETSQSLVGVLERLMLEDRHGVSKINQAGRFAFSMTRGVLNMLTPEGSDTTHSPAIYRLKVTDGSWRRELYGVDFRCLAEESDGTLLAGDTAGTVWQLETGTQDASVDIPVTLWTPVDDNGDPLSRKKPYDLQIRSDTGAHAASIAIHTDGSGTASATLSMNTSGDQMFRDDLASVSPALAFQLRVTGSFPTFKWYHYSLDYRANPQHRLILDWLPDVGTQQIWARKLRLKGILFNNVIVTVYVGTTAIDTQTMTMTSGIEDVYEVRFGRGCHGRQLRFHLAADASGTVGDVGFEPWFLELTYRGSGNTTEKTKRLGLVPAERLGAGGQEQ